MTPISSRSNAASIVLPVATAAAAFAIFIFDTMTGIDVAAAGLYVVVVLMAARFLSAWRHTGRSWVCGPDCFELCALAARDRQSG